MTDAIWRELATFHVLGQPVAQPRGKNVAVKKCPAAHISRFNLKTLADDPDPLRCGKMLPGGRCAMQAMPFSMHYPDDKKVNPWKHAIQVAAHRSRCRPEEPLDEPVRVDVDFYFRRPTNLYRKKDPDGRIFHTVRPDRDNMDKPVLDALQNARWFADDARVCAGEPAKYYTAKHGEPGAIIRVSVLTPEPSLFETLRSEDRQEDLAHADRPTFLATDQGE